MSSTTSPSTPRRGALRTLMTAIVGAAALSLALGSFAAAQDGDQKAPEKAEIGKKAPDFTLTDHTGKEHKLSDFKGKMIVLEWFNPDCPYVVKHHTDGPLADQGNEATDNGIVWLAINSGAPGQQGTGLEHNKKKMKEYGMKYPLLFDESGEVGKKYEAKRTPHMYIIDTKGILRYNGAIDNAPFGKVRGGGTMVNYVEQAIKQIEAGGTVSTTETQPYGCGVKYARQPRQGRGGGQGG